MNEDQIVDIWMGLKEYFDKKQIETIASKYIDVLADNGVSDQVFKAALGTDDVLDEAIEYYLDDWNGEDEEIDYDAEDWDTDD